MDIFVNNSVFSSAYLGVHPQQSSHPQSDYVGRVVMKKAKRSTTKVADEAALNEGEGNEETLP